MSDAASDRRRRPHAAPFIYKCIFFLPNPAPSLNFCSRRLRPHNRDYCSGDEAISAAEAAGGGGLWKGGGVRRRRHVHVRRGAA